MTKPALRKIALALAAVHPRDRRWMLARLPAAVRDAWHRHGAEATALVSPDPAAALRHLCGSVRPPHVEVPEPITLIRALDKLPVVWAARSLAVVAPDHVDLYKAACRTERQVALNRGPRPSDRTVPPALAHALAGLLQRLGSTPGGLEGVER
jgi:hypothetical protein